MAAATVVGVVEDVTDKMLGVDRGLGQDLGWVSENEREGNHEWATQSETKQKPTSPTTHHVIMAHSLAHH